MILTHPLGRQPQHQRNVSCSVTSPTGGAEAAQLITEAACASGVYFTGTIHSSNPHNNPKAGTITTPISRGEVGDQRKGSGGAGDRQGWGAQEVARGQEWPGPGDGRWRPEARRTCSVTNSEEAAWLELSRQLGTAREQPEKRRGTQSHGPRWPP